MGVLEWPRIFETCKVHRSNALIVAGHPMLLRSKLSLQPFDVAPLSEDDIAEMVRAIEPRAPSEGRRVATMINVTHDASTAFRILVCGESVPVSLVLTRHRDSSLPVGSAWESQRPIPAALSMQRILSGCVEVRCDAILSPGCPPLGWFAEDIQPLAAEPLPRELLKSMIQGVTPSAEFVRQRHGFQNFGVVTPGKFNVAVFGGHEPNLALFMNVSGT